MKPHKTSNAGVSGVRNPCTVLEKTWKRSGIEDEMYTIGTCTCGLYMYVLNLPTRIMLTT